MTSDDIIHRLEQEIASLRGEVRQLKRELAGIPVRWANNSRDGDSGVKVGKITNNLGVSTITAGSFGYVRKWTVNPDGGLDSATTSIYRVADPGMIASGDSPLVENSVVFFGRIGKVNSVLGYKC